MKFSLKSINASGCRLGELSGLRTNPELSYDTPLFVTCTKGGSIPHLCQDVYHDSFSKTSILSVPTQHVVDHLDVLQAFKKGVASFASLSTHPVCATVQDTMQETPSSYNDSSSISVWSFSGRKKLTTSNYMKLISAISPDWYEVLHDADTDFNASSKRIEKSIRNSDKFLKECFKIHHSFDNLKDVGIFVPLLGGVNPLDRRKWTEKVLKEKDADGYSITGFHLNGSSLSRLDTELIRTCVQSSLEGVPADKVRQIQGSVSIPLLLELLECGVDVFDSSFSCIAAENNLAHVYPNTMEDIVALSEQLSQATKSHSVKEEDLIESCGTHPVLNEKEKESAKSKAVSCKKTKISISDSAVASEDSSNTCESEGSQSNEVSPSSNFFDLNLKDKRIKFSKEPIVKSCKCYTCLNFTRAYLHHLVTVREMLFYVLLMIHNLHHLEVFFDTLRQSIKTNRYDLLKKVLSPHG